MAPPPRASPSYRTLLREILRLARPEGSRGHTERLRALAASLSAGGAGALAVADLAARLNAALLRRLAALFEEGRGPAPASWAWLALGSDGRREQPLPTDQDHAMVLSPGDEGEWVKDLAERLSQDLCAAGFSPCPGGLSASRWRASLPTWCDRVRGWMAEPDPESVLSAAALADARRVAGRLDPAPLRAALARAANYPRFLSELARAALEFRPAPPLLFRLGAARLDLERDGLAPVVLLARVYGLAAGAPAPGTCARLGAARAAGLIDPELASRAEDAFRVLAELRFRAGLGGGSAGPVLARALAPGDRAAALAALGAVRRLQDRAAERFLW